MSRRPSGRFTSSNPAARSARSRALVVSTLVIGSTVVASNSTSATTDPPIVWGSVGIEGSGSSVVSADLDGDGDADLATAGSVGVADAFISWIENVDGYLATRNSISTTTFGAPDLHAADLDGDGDIDILYTSGLTSTIAWFENDGNGNFDDDQIIERQFRGASAAVAADIDGDGDLDVAATGFGNATVAWFENDGSGGFGNQNVVDDEAAGANSVIATDLDGDGDVDLAVANFVADAVVWYRNDGAGNYEAARIVATVTEPVAVLDADLDGDGDGDLVTISAGGTPAWHRNDGDGEFDQAGTFATTADRTGSVVPADLDADGDIDIAAASFDDGTVEWFENDGIGAFGPSNPIDQAARGARAITAADFDDDGDTDLAMLGLGPASSVYENTPEPPRQPSAVSALDPARFVDTRESGETLDGLFESTGKLAADTELRVRFADRGSVPASARAVIANVTAVQAEGIGFVTAHPCEASRPLASSLNFTTGVNVANEIVLSLDDDGDACLYASQTTHLLVDVVGYLASDSPLTAVEPSRYLDSRPDGRTFDELGDVGLRSAGSTTTVTVAGRGSVPSGAMGAIVNVTAVRPESVGYVSAHPCLAEAPNASSLNFGNYLGAGVNQANELLVDLDDDGNLCLFVSVDTHLLVDVVGYLLPSDDVVSVGPSRLLDSRSGGVTIDGLNEGSGNADARQRLQIAGRAGIPDDAAAVALYVTAVAIDFDGFVTVGPCVPGLPTVSSLNFREEGPNVGNELIVQLDSDGGVCIYNQGSNHLTVDVAAYFR